MFIAISSPKTSWRCPAATAIEHAKILDFGLAKLRERQEGAAASSGGQVLGTPYYMAPEQVRGEPLDARADLYSLGATLYRVLTGEPPFEAPSPMSVLAKHLTEDVVPPRRRMTSLPVEADRIVLKAMRKAREDRYASAAEMAAELEAVLTSGGSSVSRPTLPLPLPPPPAAAKAPLSASYADTVADVDSIGDLDRLRRSDVDEYEWSLRRRRLLWRLLLPIGVAALSAVIGLIVWRAMTPRAESAEHEPNNTPGYANLLASGAPATGRIGTAISEREGDVDFYRIPVGRGSRQLQARVEGIPGVDLVLELFDTAGQRVVKVDDRGRGVGEWLQPTSIGPTETYIAVRELWVEGTRPTSNASDPYTLTVSWGPLQSGWEVEPNDWPSAATPIIGGNARGYLGSAEDRDWYSVAVRNKGKLTGQRGGPGRRRPVGSVRRSGQAERRSARRWGQRDVRPRCAGGTARADRDRTQTESREGSEGARLAGPIRPVRAPDRAAVVRAGSAPTQ